MDALCRRALAAQELRKVSVALAEVQRLLAMPGLDEETRMTTEPILRDQQARAARLAPQVQGILGADQQRQPTDSHQQETQQPADSHQQETQQPAGRMTDGLTEYAMNHGKNHSCPFPCPPAWHSLATACISQGLGAVSSRPVGVSTAGASAGMGVSELEACVEYLAQCHRTEIKDIMAGRAPSVIPPSAGSGKGSKASYRTTPGPMAVLNC